MLILGDQLDPRSTALDGFDPAQDLIWMVEVVSESNYVWSTKSRIAVFLAAMRHFRREREQEGQRVRYVTLDDPRNTQSFEGELRRAVTELRPERLVVAEPGEWRVWRLLEATADELRLPLDVRVDRHFFCSLERFREHAAGRKQLRMEFFYREMRREHGVLLDDEGEPEGGAWNFDPENRGSFGREGPGQLPEPRQLPKDEETSGVLSLVNERFADRPGDLSRFNWPVTPAQARAALQDFVVHRLPHFGKYQDAMWTREPWLYHARLSSSLNLKLLDPREVVAAAEKAYRQGKAELPAVEGFIRQILGWREYVRGVYWLLMPQYREKNALGAQEPLPSFYWDGKAEMTCLREALHQTLELGYAHHIQRLMVTGLYSLLLGVDPKQIHEWYLAVYVDAVEWVELPNTLGMSQYADGGIMGSKPYAATGKYIQRMSNYCAHCRFDPAKAVGDDACPFTTLYWDFLLRHQKRLASNTRMSLQLKNVAKLDPGQIRAIQARAQDIRKNGGHPRLQREALELKLQ